MKTTLQLILVAIIPVLIVGLYIYKKDKEKEPITLLLKLILSGILSCISVIYVSRGLGKAIPLFNADIQTLNTSEALLYSFLCVGLIEELSKLFYLYIFTYNNEEFNYSFDMIVYGVFASLGFAMIENIIYVLSNGFEIGLYRAITAIPLHACTGAFMGIFLSIAKQRELLNMKDVLKYKMAALFVPAILHGMYDFCAITNVFTILMVVVIMFTTVTVLNVNVHNKLDRKLKK